jgi:hypothetical protein
MTDVPPSYSSTTVRVGERTVIAVSGEIDLATVDQFAVAVCGQLHSSSGCRSSRSASLIS